MFLTLLPQRAGTAMANAPGIQDAQRSITFRSTFLRVKGVISGTAQGAIGLQGKSRARKAAGKRASCPVGRYIDHTDGGLTAAAGRNRLSSCEVGGAHH